MDDSTEPADQGQTQQAPPQPADDIEQLRERLAFYESFDQLIQDNISRAGALLREAATKKSEGDLALRTAGAEFERKQLAERTTYRRIFSSLLDEVTSVQQNVERLARQVADALDDLESVIPAAGESAGIEGEQFPSMPTFGGPPGELGSGQESRLEAAPAEQPVDRVENYGAAYAQPAAQEPADAREHQQMEPVDELVTPDEAAYDTAESTDAYEGQVPETVDTEAEPYQEAAAEPAPEPAVTSDLGAATQYFDTGESSEYQEGDVTGYRQEPPPIDEAPMTATADLNGAEETPYQASEAAEIENGSWEDTGSPAATTLLVHGVPRATTALSLKRYLEGLAQVHSVEPREYAEGVLRLQVSSDRPVGLEDLRGWPDAEGMVPVTVDEEFLEVRLNQ
jgi:hypothetical protein